MTETQSGAAPAFGSFGLDLSARDLTVAPGDDFFRYANGDWMRTVEIPADRSRWGVFEILVDKADHDVRAIVDELAESAVGWAPGTNEQKIADYYHAYLDQDAIDLRGLDPAQTDLEQIAAAASHAEIAALIARPSLPVRGPLATFITLDQRDPDRYIASLTHGGLGLPEREYYRRDDGEFPKTRAAYQAHITRMLALAGQADPDAKAAAILALETAIAELHWPIARRRERDQTYNRRSLAEVVALAPDYPWMAALNEQGLSGISEIVVRELDAIAPLAALFLETPIDTWRAYLTYHYLHGAADVLPRAFDDEDFDFYGRTLNGQPQQRERWQRAINSVGGALGEAVGQLYVARHFPPQAKQRMDQLVENLRRAYARRIDSLSWMTEETKVVAREKLATFRPKIAYPSAWRDYSNLEVSADDAFGNDRRVHVFEWERQLARLDQPTDREEWHMNPQTVNAYYNPVFNEIVFPAAILQPPFFDPNADDAVNYGAIGGVIGHEMGHGFDDQGAKSDARGVLRDWWNERDVEAFSRLTDRLASQYDAFEPLPGLNINGRLTLGENIGDNGGLSVAHEAYRIALDGAEPPVIDGFTGDRRFYLSWAQVWRTAIREARLRNQIMSDPHSPAEFRVNGVVRNQTDWYTAFDVGDGAALYLAAGERVSIW